LQKYMSVSEIAKEANVSVRTLQYYDKSGLLKPASYTEGGNRLYTDKELVILLQIKGLKQLGLSLTEIKRQMVSLDEPAKVLEILEKQKQSIQENINHLQSTLSAIFVLELEIKNSNEVNFSDYAKILSGTQESWDHLWAVGIMKQDLREHIANKFTKTSSAEATDFNNKLMGVIDEMIAAQNNGITPQSEAGKAIIESFWKIINVFLDGNMDLIPSLQEFEADLENHTGEFATKWKQAAQFINAQPNRYEGLNP